MTTDEKILKIFEKKEKVTTVDVVTVLNTSRQYASKKLSELVRRNKLIKVGSTRNAFYVKPEYASDHFDIFPNRFQKIFINKKLEEHIVLSEIENYLPTLLKLDENIKNIFIYAFSEIMNNAIEHSQSEKIQIIVSLEKDLGEIVQFKTVTSPLAFSPIFLVPLVTAF